jgi:hypothetical protein
MDLPDQGGMRVTRTDFVPDGRRAVLVGLKFEAGGADQNFTLKMDAHSELMGAYPWGETDPSQTAFNLPDTVATEGDNLVFREQGTPPLTPCPTIGRRSSAPTLPRQRALPEITSAARRTRR